MNKLLLLGVLGIIALPACDGINGRAVSGNGHQKTEERTISNASDIKIYGDFAIDLVPDSKTSLTVEADDNLLPYIITRQENGSLVIKTKEHVWLKTEGKVHITIHTNLLESIDLSGSGVIKGLAKFNGGGKLDVNISGNGDVSVEVNTPKVTADISGSGNISLAGETRSLDVDISGNGNFKGEDLKAENASVTITGSGDARVFADAQLKADITGSGDVWYKGQASTTSDITGSGQVKKIQ